MEIDHFEDDLKAALDLALEPLEMLEGLSAPEMVILEALALAGQPLTSKDLATALRAGKAAAKASMEQLLAGLEVSQVVQEFEKHIYLPIDLHEPLAIQAVMACRAAPAIAALRKLDPWNAGNRDDEQTVMRHFRYALYNGEYDYAKTMATALEGLGITWPWAQVGRQFLTPESYLHFPQEIATRLIRQTLMASINEPFPAFPALGALKILVDARRANDQEKFLYAHQLMMRDAGPSLERHLRVYGAPVVLACHKICQGDLDGLEIFERLMSRNPKLPYFTAGFLYFVALLAREGFDSPLVRAEVKRVAVFRYAFEWLLDLKLGYTSQLSGEVRDLLAQPPDGSIPHLMAILHWAGMADKAPLNIAGAAAWYNEAGYYVFGEWLTWIAGQARAGSDPPPLLRLLQIKDERWRHVLTAVSGLCVPEKVQAIDGSERLVWQIEPFVVHRKVEPRVQKLGKNGEWSSGRLIKVEDIWRQPPTCADAHDRKVFDAISDAHVQKMHQGYVSKTELIDVCFMALIGHPRVSWLKEPKKLVELVEEPVVLSVVSNAQGFQLRLNPTLGMPLVHVQRDGQGPLKVSQFTRRHWTLANLLGGTLQVPPEGEEELRRSLTDVARSGIMVSSELPLTQDLPEQAADATMVVRLSPFGEGLHATVGVTPLGPEGPTFAAGHGPVVVAEASLQVRRDLAEESDRLEQLRELLEFTGDGFSTANLLGSLELLERFLELPDGLCRVEWPEGARLNLLARISTSQLNQRVSGGTDWLAVGGEVSVNEDLVLTLSELVKRRRESGHRFITLDDGSLVALTQELEKHLLRLDRLAQKSLGAELLLHPLAVLSLDDAGFEGQAAWDTLKRDLVATDKLKPRLPKTFQGQLRAYQLDGFRWLARLAHWGVGACLADDMGLGKTVQLLALLLARVKEGPALVVAPTSVCWNWLDEAARFAPSLQVHLLAETERAEALAAPGPGELVVCSYGLLVRELEGLAKVHWGTVVLDEAQAIKNSTTQRAKAAFALQARFRVAATGTPVENHLDELWSLFRFLNPGMLGSRQWFSGRFTCSPEAQEDLSRQVRPFILRRTKDQVLPELPARTDILEKIPLSEEERALYESLRRQALGRLQGDEDYLSILAELTRLRQACCHPRLAAPDQDLPSSKVARFLELVEELLDNGHRALVFSQFVSYLEILRAELDRRSIGYQYLVGSSTPAARKKAVNAFQAGQGSLFLISLKAGGTGLNLTAADYVIHMDPWWNPAVEDQASDRAHRIGQLRPVTVYRLVAQDTVEEQMVTLHLAKRDLARRLLEGTDASARLSAGELAELLRGD